MIKVHPDDSRTVFKFCREFPGVFAFSSCYAITHIKKRSEKYYLPWRLHISRHDSSHQNHKHKYWYKHLLNQTRAEASESLRCPFRTQEDHSLPLLHKAGLKSFHHHEWAKNERQGQGLQIQSICYTRETGTENNKKIPVSTMRNASFVRIFMVDNFLITAIPLSPYGFYNLRLIWIFFNFSPQITHMYHHCIICPVIIGFFPYRFIQMLCGKYLSAMFD